MQGGQATGGEHEVRQAVMGDLVQRAKQPAAWDRQQDEAERPSEWSGFIYNPYSGDLLPPEDDEDEDEQGGAQSGSADRASGRQRYQRCSVFGIGLVAPLQLQKVA